MTQDQLRYQELMEEKRHNLEAERVATSDVEQKQRATSVSEKWYNDQIAIRNREQELKEKQFKWQKSVYLADSVYRNISMFSSERQHAWDRVVDAYGMAKSALFS